MPPLSLAVCFGSFMLCDRAAVYRQFCRELQYIGTYAEEASVLISQSYPLTAGKARSATI